MTLARGSKYGNMGDSREGMLSGWKGTSWSGLGGGEGEGEGRASEENWWA